MTLFDLWFIALVLTAIGTLISAVILAVQGRGGSALRLLGKLAICSVVYIGLVYGVTAVAKEPMLRVGEPECSDDWCIAVTRVQSGPAGGFNRYDVDLRIFSRALRVSQRELSAKDVYLVDAQWRRYDPVHSRAEVPLNVRLGPGESVNTSRRFDLPFDVHPVGIIVDRGAPPFCLIIGECDAFHKATMVRIE